MEPPFYARINEESESENEVDEEISNLLDMCDETNNILNKNDSNYINSTIEALSKSDRFKINQNNTVNVNLEPEEIIKNTESSIRAKKFNLPSLLPSTDDLHEKNIKWQLSLKMEKEKLRRGILYGTSDQKK